MVKKRGFGMMAREAGVVLARMAGNVRSEDVMSVPGHRRVMILRSDSPRRRRAYVPASTELPLYQVERKR